MYFDQGITRKLAINKMKKAGLSPTKGSFSCETHIYRTQFLQGHGKNSVYYPTLMFNLLLNIFFWYSSIVSLSIIPKKSV